MKKHKVLPHLGENMDLARNKSFEVVFWGESGVMWLFYGMYGVKRIAVCVKEMTGMRKVKTKFTNEPKQKQ